MACDLRLLLTILLFGIVRSGLADGGKTIGPNDARDHEFPYTVSVRLNGRHWCGGAIISNQHILTAATCFRYLPKTLPCHITVTSGTNFLNRDGETHEIKDYIIHPKYEESIEKVGFEWSYDIALIKLRQPMEFNEYQQKIELPIRKPPVNKNAAISAWTVSTGGSRRKLTNLQTVTLRILSRKQCQKHFDFIDTTDSIVCGLRDKQTNICLGDVGSPLVHKSHLVGVVASGMSCTIPNVFTNVYKFVDEIKEWMTW